ncbi:MAG: hypothetical protein R3E08_13930 [Thiotrichaceae bacterium]
MKVLIPALAKQLDALLDKIVTTYHKPAVLIRVERAGQGLSWSAWVGSA